jgi:fructokinase
MICDIMIVGEAGVDFLPGTEGSTENVQEFTRRAGGSAINSAIGLAHLDEIPLLRTRIGDDPFGAFLHRTLEEHDIPLEYVATDSAASTSLAFIQRCQDASLDFTFYRHETADTRLQSNAIPTSVLEDLSRLHVTGVLLASDQSRSAIMTLIERAKTAGCRVSFNPNTRPQLWDQPEKMAQDIGDAISFVDEIIATPADFAGIGFDIEDPTQLAARLTDRGPDSVFLSLDSISAYGYVTEGPLAGEFRHDGYGIDPVYPIGATDAFTAGIIASLINDASKLTRIIKSANAVASISTMSPGAITAFSLKRSAQSLYPDLVWKTE